MAARTQVFDTVELLENILFHLPPRELLPVERVSRQWQTVVKNSPKLQHALFFTPVRGGPLELIIDENGTNKHWVRAPSTSPSTILRNTLLDPLFQLVVPVEGDYSLFAKLSPAWRRPEASWRRMLPSQPAIKSAAYVELTGLAEFWCAFYCEKILPAFSSEHTRIGEVFDQLDAKYGRFPYGEKKVVIVGLDRALRSHDGIEDLMHSSR